MNHGMPAAGIFALACLGQLMAAEKALSFESPFSSKIGLQSSNSPFSSKIELQITPPSSPPAAKPNPPAEAKPPAEKIPAAAPAPKPETIKSSGTVSVTRNAAGKVTSLKLVAMAYEIAPDEASKPLESMDGQKAKVFYDKLARKDGKSCLTVTGVATTAEQQATAPVVNPNIVVQKPKEKAKTGIVKLSKDEAGAVTGITLLEIKAEIALDEASKPLESMDGQKVTLTGTLSPEGNRPLFHISPAPAAPAQTGKP